ncbi:MAG: error-prone DNA polymerase [Archangium gephyra]|uniref:Error-prone DNA polymerase n=1 Tax=Archangium gephyra TaxID=48 RepID=A0A2W5W2Q2_9BACT|nr:MAG: error-prone DNA polymerase [Archangium gephyra]
MSGALLWCKSNFSFLEGASHPEELVEMAHQLGYPAIAVTDRDGVHGVVRAHEKARELGIKLIIGSEVTLDDGATIVLLAMTRRGYANLCRLLTVGRMRCGKGRSEVTRLEVAQHAEDVIALWKLDGPHEALLAAFGDRLYGLIARHHRPEDIDLEATQRARAQALGVPLVAAPEILYHHVERRPLQDVLTCIRHQLSLPEAGRLLKPNDSYAVMTKLQLERRYGDQLQWVRRSGSIAERCTFSMSELRYRYPTEKLPGGKTTTQHLEELVFAGAVRRNGLVSDKMRAQLRKELELIEQLDYGGYFLTMWELVEFCKANDIICQGRGSAASSAVCYCLGITAVDPVKMDLLFERFLSLERAEPPDIDLDIEHERREEVIQHLYEKHGRTHAAMVANVISYRARSAVREVGKALGVAQTELDRYAKLLHFYDAPDGRYANDVGLDASSKVFEQLMTLCRELEGFPRHLSIHPGGFILGHDPIDTLVPVENATMPNRTVIQWSKDDVEALGLFKVDLLALGSLTHLHKSFRLIEKHRGRKLTLATIPSDDKKTYEEFIQKADTIGVFQIESRAQMSMLPRLKPKHYYDIVVQVSIVRPGPITGGMVHPYLRRRENPEEISYPHECLKPVLERTLGVPLFQEQVMRIAIVGAGYKPGEADQLRRDMAPWRRNGRLERHHDKFVKGMIDRGIAPDFAERVFQQIRGFGEYGFPESHAASFALISYAGSYLKAHYPVEFTAGLLNSLPMGFYSPSTIIEDAKRHRVEVRPIDLRHSAWDCTLEPVKSEYEYALRMGLKFVKGLNQEDATKLIAARDAQSITELARRSGVQARPLTLLAEAGALQSIEPSRRVALWQAQGLHGGPTPLAVDTEPQMSFAGLTVPQSISWDYSRSSHSTLGHPVGPLRQQLKAQGLKSAVEIKEVPHGHPIRAAGVVICRQRPGTASGVTFMTLEDETGLVNLVVWRDVFEAYSVLARTRTFLGVEGTIQKQGEVVHVMAAHFFEPGEVSASLPPIESRDFH